MVKFEKISVDKNNVIQILSWNTYQSEYQRQRDYQAERRKKLTTQTYNADLRIDIDIDKDIDINKIKKNNIIKDIISYLNLKSQKNFRSDSKIAIKNITARLNENYTLEDFKKVIDIKCSHWLEPKKGETDMSIYLTPDTLFGNKFEKYLNQNANRQAIKEAVTKEQEWEKEKAEDYSKPVPEEIKKHIKKLKLESFNKTI
jgi:uncharacterized phage protein (TIGR02220 family)